MKKEKFSVLMSVYDKESPCFLFDALNSVFEQTLQADEVILVEDGILNSSLENVILDFESKYKNLKVLRFESNRGLGEALNDGLRACKNEYVFRMDTDDICRKDRFEVQMKYLIKNPNIDILGTNMIEYDYDMKNIVSKKVVPETHEEIRKYIKKRNPMNHPTVVYKKSKVLEVNSYEDYPFFEDYYLWAKMIKNGCVFYNMQEELYNFRTGFSMIRRRGGLKYLKYIKKLEKGLFELNIINKKEYYFNIFVRSIISLCPISIRRIVYKKILRIK